MIDSYRFGQMVIDGKTYSKDVIILPDRTVISPWWRKEGHRLSLSDLNDILKALPSILVVGCGSPGLMKPEAGLEETLSSKGIMMEVMPTEKAVRRYNQLKEEGELIAACFHLTC